MNLVLDASAAVRIAMGQPDAAHLARLVQAAGSVRAPELFVAEVTNTFWKISRHGGVSQERCASGLALACSLPDELDAMSELRGEVFELACRTGKPAYDLFYLVLARRHAATLLTLDRGLLKLANAHGVRVP